MSYDKLSLSPDLLRTFLAAAESGSFTDAARTIHRTQAAVSMQIKRLESELGCPVFNREGRGVTMTSKGKVLHEYARRLLTLHSEAVAAVTGPRGHDIIRFGAPEDYAAHYLPGALKRFGATHPAVQVDVCCADSDRLRAKIVAGNLDIALTTEAEPEETDSRPLPLAWLLAARGAPVEQHPLPLALYDEGCLYRRNGLTALDRSGIEYRIAYTSPSMSGVIAAVRAGLAVAPVAAAPPVTGCRLALTQDGLPPIPPVAVRLRSNGLAESDTLDAFTGFLRLELNLAPF